MKIEQTFWTSETGYSPSTPGILDTAQLVLLFGSRLIMEDRNIFPQIQKYYPEAHIIGCSTAGEICSTKVLDESLVITAIYFDHSRVICGEIDIAKAGDSFSAGQRLARSLPDKELVHAFVLSDGLCVNGSDLVKGLVSQLPEGVTVTGGLSGDGPNFQQTCVMANGQASGNRVAIIGFYGKRLRIGYGSLGGWDPFGPERLITRSQGNVLYEFDNHSALELYKQYLGEHSKGLPATGLLFPLSLRSGPGEDTSVVRTILAVNEKQQSMTFAGDVPEGSYARLMKANINRLIDGAAGAAATSKSVLQNIDCELAILISCVGRKMVLKQRIEEEVEAVREVLGARPVLTGFYSYGEISPFSHLAQCELHNQTMTITTFAEVQS